MASAGRILIMPKGNYNTETKYEKLDLVFHSGASWLAKKDAVGIEPSDANAEYWFKMCEGSNTTELEQRIAAIENQLLSVTNLDDIDLSAYATKAEVNAVSEDVALLEETVDGLSNELGGLKTIAESLPSSFGKVQILSYVGDGFFGSEGTACSVTADFPPKVLVYLGYYRNSIDFCVNPTSTTNVILCEHLTTSYRRDSGFRYAPGDSNSPDRYAKKSEDGKTIYWYVQNDSGLSSQQLNESGSTYYILAVG